MKRSNLPAFALVAAALFNFACLRVSLAADNVPLQSQCQTGDLTRITATLEVSGKLTLHNGAKTEELPLKVTGRFAYDEAALANTSDQAARRSARYYRTAEAEIAINGQADRPKLRDDRRLILVESAKQGFVISSAGGLLTREELDLIDIPGNSLALDALLPSEHVEADGHWKPAEAGLRDLLGLDAVSASTVECHLTSKTDAAADIAFSGQVDGAVSGVSTEIQLEGAAAFDRHTKRLTLIQMRIKERRSTGHVSPGIDAVADLKLEIAPLAASEQLTPTTLARLATEAKATDAPPALALRSEAGGYDLAYDRRWHVTHDEAEVTVLRLLDRGELVAQCNISLLPPLPEGKPLSLEDFQADVKHSLGKNFGDFETASEGKTAAGLHMLRVVATGTVSELPIEWRYYLVTNSSGRRIAVTFTLEQKLAERFADADTTMVESLTMLKPTTPSLSSADSVLKTDR